MFTSATEDNIPEDSDYNPNDEQIFPSLPNNTFSKIYCEKGKGQEIKQITNILTLHVTSIDPLYNTNVYRSNIKEMQMFQSKYFISWDDYRPQTKFLKVMFSQVSVCPLGGVCGREAYMAGKRAFMVGGIHGRGDA